MIHPAAHRPLEPNPALARHAHERAQSVQNRLADRITAFAGSMAFVYTHLAWFGCWIGLGVEHYPYGLLNRADAKRQAIADQRWQTVQKEDCQNEELLGLSRQILDLTKAIHSMAAQIDPGAANWQRTSAASIANPPKETR